MKKLNEQHQKETTERIARDVLNFETLERRWSDRLDFKDTAVWCAKEALEAAYRAGFEAARACR